MPPIPIHKNAPIKPINDGITPKTSGENKSPSPSSSSSSTSSNDPTRTVPASIPATTTANANANPNHPPPPQPGARPVAPTPSVRGGDMLCEPALPQPQEHVQVQVQEQAQAQVQGRYTAHHITTTTTKTTGPPPQYTQAPPLESALAGRSTVTTDTGAGAGAGTGAGAGAGPGRTVLNLGPVASPFQTAETATRASLEHPPGYQQAPDNAPYTVGGGIGGHGGSGEGSAGSDQGVGATAWNYLTKAGEALKKGEEAAWRAMRNK